MREIVTLSNGKRVSNFSSPHPFEFEDGSILPAISEADSIRLQMEAKETLAATGGGDIKLSFVITPDVINEIKYWQNEWRLGNVDVVFCPLPMLSALKDYYFLEVTPFRTIRCVDRISKKVSITKQCLI